MAIDGLVLRDPKESQRGPKRALLYTATGERLKQAFRRPTTSPFGPTSYERESLETRKGFAVLVTEELSDFFTSLDVWARAYVQEHSKRLFGKELNEEQVAKAYVSCLKKREDAPELVRLKINMAEPKACLFWNKAKEEIEPPGSWEDLPVKMNVLVSHLWVMGTGAQVQFGLVCIVEDVMVMRKTRVCPEALADDDEDDE